MGKGAVVLPLLALAACVAVPAAAPDKSVSSSDPPAATLPQPTGPTSDCPITGSSDWNAWVNAMPGPDRPKLIVIGKVQVPGGDRRVELQVGPIRESHPPVQEIMVRVIVPRGGSTGGLVEHDVRVETPALSSYGAVVVRCGARILATIDNVIRAY